MTEAQLQKLVKILQAEYQLNQNLLELGEKKQGAIINEEVEVLEEIVREEEGYLADLEKLEGARANLVQNKKMTDLIAEVGQPYREQLSKLRKRMFGVIEELAYLNKTNEQLLKDALYLTNINLNILTNNQGKGTYNKRGADADRQQGQTTVINQKA
ncbi:flagellar protein FlgN [Natroniella sulfidigena]|uniref:flagellar export chaperone FlgN n=1 Tax=Natroniella sulfidigena TaxID=723921 RepID=UPI00200ACBCA|nr:flagellar protein FlgN [Natroniella sulfidigena]